MKNDEGVKIDIESPEQFEEDVSKILNESDTSAKEEAEDTVEGSEEETEASEETAGGEDQEAADNEPEQDDQDGAKEKENKKGGVKHA